MHLFTLQHSEMLKALTILSAVINKKHLCFKKKVFDEGQHTKHIFTLLHSEMPKALTILSAVINKIHWYLKKRSLMRVNIQNAFIYLTTLRNAQCFDHSECSNK